MILSGKVIDHIVVDDKEPKIGEQYGGLWINDGDYIFESITIIFMDNTQLVISVDREADGYPIDGIGAFVSEVKK